MSSIPTKPTGLDQGLLQRLRTAWLLVVALIVLQGVAARVVENQFATGQRRLEDARVALASLESFVKQLHARSLDENLTDPGYGREVAVELRAAVERLSAAESEALRHLESQEILADAAPPLRADLHDLRRAALGLAGAAELEDASLAELRAHELEHAASAGSYRVFETMMRASEAVEEAASLGLKMRLGGLGMLLLLTLAAHFALARPTYQALGSSLARSRETEERFEVAVSGSSDGLWDYDPKSGRVWYSERFCEMLGERSLPPNISSFEDRLHPADHGRTMTAVRRHLEEREPYDVEYRLQTAAGEYRWFHARGQAVWDANGKPVRMAGNVQDIHARKRDELALARSERRMKALIDSAYDAIVVARVADDRIVEFNPAAVRVFGLERAEALGRAAGSLLQLEQRFEAVEAFASVEGMVRRPDGQVMNVEVSAGEFEDENDAHRVYVVRDMTDKRELELQLQQAQKMEAIGQLAAGIAHEINTPTQYVTDNTRFLEESFQDLLTAIDGMTDALDGAENGDVDAVRERIDALKEEIELDFLRNDVPEALRQSIDGLSRTADIVRSMKEFSHPGQDAMTAVDLNRALETTLTVSRSEWKHVAELALDLDEALPQVKCLPGEINQVFLNLIVNAAHAISDASDGRRTDLGRLGISTCGGEGCVEIRISDDGCGMTEEVKQRVFDPFFTTKEVGRGTGQGLAIAHGVVVQKHEGTIEIESEPGVGTTFVIRLPL